METAAGAMEEAKEEAETAAAKAEEAREEATEEAARVVATEAEAMVEATGMEAMEEETEAEETEAERSRKELARRTREQTVHTEKPYSEPGPSHRGTLKDKPQPTPSELLERKQWQEGRATRKQEADEKMKDAQRAAKERARKKAQKQRKKAALLAQTDDHVPSKPQEIKLADYVK